MASGFVGQAKENCPLTPLNLTHMKINCSNHIPSLGLLTAVLLAIGATAGSAAAPTLKDAYKDHFYVGVAINRNIATGTADQADFVNRTSEQVTKDIALVKEQFNQIVPENDLKWALIH